MPKNVESESKYSDNDKEQSSAQFQALTDYQMTRDRDNRTTNPFDRYDFSYLVSYVFATASFVEDKEPLCFPYVFKNSYYSLWKYTMKEEMILGCLFLNIQNKS